MLGSIITCAVFLEILPSSWNLAGWLGIPKLIYVIMKTFENTKLCSFIVTAWMIIKLAIIYPTSVLVPPKMDGSLFMRLCPCIAKIGWRFVHATMYVQASLDPDC